MLLRPERRLLLTPLQQALANQPLSLTGLDLAILLANKRLCKN
jgi:hypothetical protein